MSEMNIGGLLVAIGTIVFVVAAGPIIFRALGVVCAVVAINYGLQKMGTSAFCASSKLSSGVSLSITIEAACW